MVDVLERLAATLERSTALIALRPGGEAALGAALDGMGLAMPAMGRFVESDGLLLARVAPGQALAMRLGTDAPLMAELAPLAEAAGLIDLSDARIGVVVEGADARERLGRLVALDLHPSRFRPGQCAQTLVAHLSVLLLQTGEQAYELQCARSYAGSFLRAMRMA